MAASRCIARRGRVRRDRRHPLTRFLTRHNRFITLFGAPVVFAIPPYGRWVDGAERGGTRGAAPSPQKKVLPLAAAARIPSVGLYNAPSDA